MNLKAKQNEKLSIMICFALGILVELSFFHGIIGVSYLLFITAFYSVLFYRFRYAFEHRRIGLLLMVGIWIMSASYLFYDSTVFRFFNSLLIPITVFFQIVLITSPGNLKWGKLSFVRLVTGKLFDSIDYFIHYVRTLAKKLIRKHAGSGTYLQIVLGILVSVPLLFIIIHLLMSADLAFKEYILKFSFIRINVLEIFIRIGIIIVSGLFFYAVFQVLGKRVNRLVEIKESSKNIHGVMALTIILLLNIVYFVFITIQFTYFFNDTLQGGFTYAEYARRGFFELIVVTIINWTIIILFLKKVKAESKGLQVLIKTFLSTLIVESSLILLSAYHRLSLYEQAYGYTMDRLLAHAFMLFLIVIFAYTLMRVWLENLSLLHFYLITGFIFYAILNAVNIEEIIVNNNLKRYDETEKVDIHYLNYLGAEGIYGLIEIYNQNPDYPELKEILEFEKEKLLTSGQENWQAFNFSRKEARQRLMELEL